MALAMIQVTSAAPNDNSNGTGGTPEIVAAIDSLAEQLAESQLDATERFDTIDATLATLSTLLGDETDELDGAVSALRTLLSAETDEIDATFVGVLPAFEQVHGWVDAVANPDPLTTTVTTCAEYGGSGELGIESTAEVLAELAARGGVNLFGTGITAEVKPTWSAAASSSSSDSARSSKRSATPAPKSSSRVTTPPSKSSRLPTTRKQPRTSSPSPPPKAAPPTAPAAQPITESPSPAATPAPTHQTSISLAMAHC